MDNNIKLLKGIYYEYNKKIYASKVTKNLLLVLLLTPVFAFATQSNELEFVAYDKGDSFKLQSYPISAAYVTNCDSCSENAQVKIKNNTITFDADRHDSVATVAFAQ